MNSRPTIICLLAAFIQCFCRAADTNLPTDANALNLFVVSGLSTKLIATGEWSKPVSGGHGTKISGRLLVYDGAYFTNEFGKPSWFAAPVFLEITNETGFSTQIYVNWENDVRFELHGANGKPADDLTKHGGISYAKRRSYWASVPAVGLLRLRANRNVAYTELAGTEHSNPDGLILSFRPGENWLMPAGDTNAYFLSATFSPQPANSSPDSNAVWQATLEFPAVKLGSSALK